MLAVPNFVPGSGNTWQWVWNSKENYLFPLPETLACKLKEQQGELLRMRTHGNHCFPISTENTS